ncbi:superoxide dismutase, Ni [Actibacterium sp. 188UL27-1]|uniref:superoxide dismutase, Ni n=1 Tax=Actibacterium sp. 188UL27-1 TaxID=2786961 RepID=UPI00195A7934|nr:superoxide dismutase, Ni [Actibacterium sp. 188UL27-1]MBM7068286.1 superoxide dismutase, Ni [Actibacterium sp. 188UL27-1]
MTKTRLLDQIFGIEAAAAHCDIPCKIYDPSTAIIAAHSVVRMLDLIHENAEKEMSAGVMNTIIRCVRTKEIEAAKVKDEIRIIWGDYIKAPQIEKHPNVHDLTHSIMLTASKCKVELNRADGEQLVELVNQFAEMFWDTKGVATARKPAPYNTNLDMVVPQH